MAQRTIEGPDKDMLTLREVAEYLRLQPRTLRRLIADGRFFAPIEVSPGVKVWSAEDVAVWRAYRERLSRLGPPPPPNPGKPPAGQR